MSIYTYVVDHGKESPRVSCDTQLNGGKVTVVMFDDGLKRLEEMEEFISKLRDETSCDQTKYSIDDFIN